MRISALLLFATIISSCFLFSCTKDPVIEEIHKDTTLGNNNPPPYTGVSDDKITAYINKLYIDLLGRAPTSNEITDDLQYLDENGLSDASRDFVIQQLIISKPYYTRLFSINANEFLNGTDSLTVEYQILLLQYFYDIDSAAGNTYNLIYYTYELNRLYELQNLTANYMSGSITMNEYYAVFINNYFYDEVNMGSENFVKGSFDDLFRRAPTVDELMQGVNIVNNGAGILFLQNGDSKGDYIKIVTTCDAFYEGLVKKTFEQLLLREPTSAEEGTYTTQLKSTLNYQEFEKTLMKTSEYAGF
ncbi:MAG TPA: hypothetical protein VE978_27655 [Chitinophagales bacterium]|nr:hypothetical protein [Chitinophagales bacterium]